jgi:DNA-binding XRE family transcriptional regulator
VCMGDQWADEAVDVMRVRRIVGNGQLRDLRSEARLSLADVGRAVGVCPSTVLRWESGSMPRWHHAVRLGALLLYLSDES